MPAQSLTFPAPPKLPSGREIYDWIMGQIEPELMSSALTLLKQKYTNETSEKKEARRIRYNQAFAKYYEMYQAYIEDMHARIRRYHREAMRSLEEHDRQREEQSLNDLAASLFTLT